MKLYKTILTPDSNFATVLKGDTLFGQMCWSVAHLFGKERLEALLSDYDTHPFAVVSDAFAPGYLPKPHLPMELLGTDVANRKEARKRVWMRYEDLQSGDFTLAKTDVEAGVVDENVVQVHNSLNYLNFNTGDEAFAPYRSSEIRLSPKEIYCLIDENRLSCDALQQLFAFMGAYGYGKESSIGKGRFTVSDFTPVELATTGRAFMTLSPSVLEGQACSSCYYDTFVRFGKHGDRRAHTNAFKRPLLMAEHGAVLLFDAPVDLCFAGKAVRGISPAYPDTVHQGYAITVAIKEPKR